MILIVLYNLMKRGLCFFVRWFNHLIPFDPCLNWTKSVWIGGRLKKIFVLCIFKRKKIRNDTTSVVVIYTVRTIKKLYSIHRINILVSVDKHILCTNGCRECRIVCLSRVFIHTIFDGRYTPSTCNRLDCCTRGVFKFVMVVEYVLSIWCIMFICMEFMLDIWIRTSLVIL